MTKINLWREGFILHLHTIVHNEMQNQGRSSKQEPGGRNWSKGHGEMLLTGLLLLVQLSFLYSTGLYRDATAHSGLDPPTYTIDQENSPIDMLSGYSEGGDSSVEVPLSHMTLVYGKLTKTNQYSTFSNIPVISIAWQGKNSDRMQGHINVLIPLRYRNLKSMHDIGLNRYFLERWNACSGSIKEVHIWTNYSSS